MSGMTNPKMGTRKSWLKSPFGWQNIQKEIEVKRKKAEHEDHLEAIALIQIANCVCVCVLVAIKYADDAAAAAASACTPNVAPADLCNDYRSTVAPAVAAEHTVRPHY